MQHPCLGFAAPRPFKSMSGSAMRVGHKAEFGQRSSANLVFSRGAAKSRNARVFTGNSPCPA
jgi:hypothetical protein